MAEDANQAVSSEDTPALALDLTGLTRLTIAEIEAAEDDGFLAGNQEYLDLSFLGVTDLAECIVREGDILHQFRETGDSASSETAFIAGRKIQDEVETLWHLDVGVASATVALIASGAHPFLSCNGGLLGAPHSRPHPLVRFYLQDLQPDQLRQWLARSGLSALKEDGYLVLRSDHIEPFYLFAQAALETLSKTDR